MSDGVEVNIFSTDPLAADSDNDGLSDGIEVNVVGTKPSVKDSDGDGIPDGNEDTDSDGLSDAEELNKYGTCLLYTSPSPRDQRGSRMPSSA